MPTVLLADGFQFRIYPNDHAPAHVHAFIGGAEAIVTLSPVSVRNVYGMRPSHVTKAVAIVEGNLDTLLNHWEKIHG